MSASPLSPDLRAAQRKYARWTRLQLMISLPSQVEALSSSRLFEVGREYYLIVDADAATVAAIAATLDQVRPVTLVIRIITSAPANAIELSTAARVLDDAWLVDQPLRQWDINALLSLAEPNLPAGFVDFNFAQQCLEFISPIELDMEQMQRVRTAAADKLDLNIRAFRMSDTAKPHEAPDHALPLARQLGALPGSVRQLVERDEDLWRDYCGQEDQFQVTARPSLTPLAFSGLIHADGQGQATLADLLAIYDVVNLLPPESEAGWLDANAVTYADMQQLAADGRVRLVLPRSIVSYPLGLTSALAEAAPESLILSRTLAVRTIAEGQKRDPLLHGSIPDEAKAALLGALVTTLPAPLGAMVSQLYQEPLRHRRMALALQGAFAWYGQCLGARLAQVMWPSGTQGAQVEWMTAGAAVEWSMALDASYVPSRFGEYDESTNAMRIAGLISRGPQRRMPTSHALHQVADGLLTIGGLSPMEVAQLGDGARTRFRKLACGLMTHTADPQQLQEAVDAINREVLAFENKSKHLRRWGLGALGGGAVGKVIGDGVDGLTLPFASVVAWWLAGLAKQALPKAVRDELDHFRQGLLATAMLTPIDAVIVSQARAAISAKASNNTP